MGKGETVEEPGAPARRPSWRWRAGAGVAALAALGVGVLTAPDPGASPDAPGAATPPATEAEVVDVDGGGYSTVPVAYDHRLSPPVDSALLDGLRFTDATAEAGLDAPHLDRAPDGTNDMSGGAAVGDVDGDGDLDLYLTRVGLPNLLYRNDGDGTFTDVAAEAGVQGRNYEAGYAGAVFADVDGDGDLDLLVTSVGQTVPLLYVNDGTGTFTEEAEPRGLVWPEVDPATNGAGLFSAAFSDWDLDGDLDLAVVEWYTAPTGHFALEVEPPLRQAGDAPWDANDQCARAAAMRAAGHPLPPDAPAPRTRLLANDGGGRFTDVTAELGVDPVAMAAFTVTFADQDGDGWPDMFVAGDFCTSRLYRNEGGRRFVDVTEELGVGTDENGMGQAVEDIDGDGHLDWVVSSISLPPDEGPCPLDLGTTGCSGNRVYLGGPDGFTDATDRFGVRDAHWAWGVVAQDLTNTGRRDLVVTNGWSDPDHVPYDLHRPEWAIFARSAGSPSRLWRNTGDGPWPEVAEAVGFTGRANGKAIVALDYDDDGDLDLLEVNTEAAPVLHRNDTPTGAGHRWLRVRLSDPGSGNTHGVGARVTVVTTSGREVVGEVRAGGTFQSGDPAEVHAGLGDDGVDRVEVRWPGTDGPEEFDADDGAVVTLTRGDGR